MKLWWWKLTYLQLKYIQPINMQKNQASFAYSILVRCSDSKKMFKWLLNAQYGYDNVLKLM